LNIKKNLERLLRYHDDRPIVARDSLVRPVHGIAFLLAREEIASPPVLEDHAHDAADFVNSGIG
jgi:hypothetical protein